MNYNKIREYCDQNGLSISDLAKKTKIPMASIYRHIQDKSMKVETLEKIANVLNVPIWHFFDLDPETPYIKDIEAQKKSNEINQEVMAQMTKVIDELKMKLKNIKQARIIFQWSRELVAYQVISKKEYEIQIHLFIDFLESDQGEAALEKFQQQIEDVVKRNKINRDQPTDE